MSLAVAATVRREGRMLRGCTPSASEKKKSRRRSPRLKLNFQSIVEARDFVTGAFTRAQADVYVRK